ncbi:helicase RepA family protein [Sinorhizobium medicae WSM1115]|uniref:AAA family ATPase n=1 Tax=Sinorhizobium medicae TaxID=110321 RepID=UPI00036CA9A7|nr:AAA family ATPase [Sinorhizobium medicae]UFX00313.1 helicase RepA family protein [Sinorhizobium medicae WSM1115]
MSDDERPPHSNKIIQFPVKILRYRLKDPKLLPIRPWLVRGLLLRRCITEIIAAGGTGKSSLGLALAIHLAAGRSFGPFEITERHRVAVLSVEEDEAEFDRRMCAVAIQYGIKQADFDDYLFKIHITDDQHVLGQAGKSGTVTATKAMSELERLLAHEQIEAFTLDPFIELWTGNENDNNQVKAVLAIFRATARRLNMACLLTHHVRKGIVTPGDIDASRGGSSSGGLVRLAFTLTNITAEMANTLGLEGDDPLRRQLVRLDRAKGNYTPNDDRIDWFRWQNVDLDNDPEGITPDHVGVLVPWNAPGLFVGVTTSQIHTVLDVIAAAAERGEAFSPSRQAKRWAGYLLMEHFEWNEEQAAKGMKVWLGSGLLVECNSRDGRKRDMKGVNVDEKKRPDGDSMSL